MKLPGFPVMTLNPDSPIFVTSMASLPLVAKAAGGLLSVT
ncbi:unnamed protein product, partial [marine sediment metagenome]